MWNLVNLSTSLDFNKYESVLGASTQLGFIFVEFAYGLFVASLSLTNLPHTLPPEHSIWSSQHNVIWIRPGSLWSRVEICWGKSTPTDTTFFEAPWRDSCNIWFISYIWVCQCAFRGFPIRESISVNWPPTTHQEVQQKLWISILGSFQASRAHIPFNFPMPLEWLIG